MLTKSNQDCFLAFIVIFLCSNNTLWVCNLSWSKLLAVCGNVKSLSERLCLFLTLPQEHFNYYSVDSALGHLVFSVKYDVIGDQEHLRLLFRYFKHVCSCLFPNEKCIALMFWILSCVSLIHLSENIFS